MTKKTLLKSVIIMSLIGLLSSCSSLRVANNARKTTENQRDKNNLCAYTIPSDEEFSNQFSGFFYKNENFLPLYDNALSQEALVADSRIIKIDTDSSPAETPPPPAPETDYAGITVYDIISPDPVVEEETPVIETPSEEETGEEIIVVNLDDVKKQETETSELIPYESIEVVVPTTVKADSKPDLTDYVALASQSHEDVWNTTIEEKVTAVHAGYFTWVAAGAIVVAVFFSVRALLSAGRTEREERERQRYQQKKEFEQYSESQEIVSRPGLEYEDIKASDSESSSSGNPGEHISPAPSELLMAEDYPVDPQYQRYTPVAKQISDNYRSLTEEQRKELFKAAMHAQLLRV